MKIKINEFDLINLLSIYELREIGTLIDILYDHCSYVYLRQGHVEACDIQFVRMYGISKDVNASSHSEHILL